MTGDTLAKKIAQTVISIQQEREDRERAYPTCEKCGRIMRSLHEPPFFACDCEEEARAAQGDLLGGKVIAVVRADYPGSRDPEEILYLRIKRPNGEILRLEVIADQLIFWRDPESPQPAHLPPENPDRR